MSEDAGDSGSLESVDVTVARIYWDLRQWLRREVPIAADAVDLSDLHHETIRECLLRNGAFANAPTGDARERIARGIVRNIARRYRARRRFAIASEPLAAGSGSAPGPSTELDGIEARKLWRAVWDRVAGDTIGILGQPFLAQRLMHLRWHEGLAPAAIGRVLGLPAGEAAAKAVSSALRRLKQRLREGFRSDSERRFPTLDGQGLAALEHALLRTERGHGVGDGS